MTDAHDIEARLDRLAHENAELSGLVLATGVILTQLLQTMTLRELNPQARTYWAPVTETNEAAILTAPDGQLYIVLGPADEDGRWQLRLWWKPFVTLIWVGGLMIAFGGLLSLIGRLRRERRVSEREEAYA